MMDAELENVVCNICGSADYEERYYSIRSGELVRCRKCDFYYANPRRIEFISEVINDKTPSSLNAEKSFNYMGRIQEFVGYLKEIEAFKPSKGKILDIGCYDGHFLAEARNRGWQTFGVEPHRGGASYARDELGLDVRQCVLEKASFEEEYFDVVTILSTLEHVPDPEAVLRGVSRIIKSDGLLVIAVPYIPFYLTLIKSRWRMFIGDHYWFFTDASMAKLLGKHGFSILRRDYIKKSVDLDIISARLAADWQPMNLGRIGRLIRRVVTWTGIARFRFVLNLYDVRVYYAVRQTAN